MTITRTLFVLVGVFAGCGNSSEFRLADVKAEQTIGDNHIQYGLPPDIYSPLGIAGHHPHQRNMIGDMGCGIRMIAADYNNDGRLDRIDLSIADLKQLHDCYSQIRVEE